MKTNKPQVRSASKKPPNSSTSSSKRQKPGRQSSSVGEVRQELFHRLVAEPEFLASPLSEKAVFEEIQRRQENFRGSLSSTREALIELIAHGLLIRSEKGISRDILSPRDLTEFFGIRIQIELFSIESALADERLRPTVTMKLMKIVSEQRELLESREIVDRIRWFEKSVEFHASIAVETDNRRRGELLKKLMWQTRIGAKFDLESEEEQRHATEEHDAFCSIIGGFEPFDRQEFINHFRDPFERALDQIDAEQRMRELWWQHVLRISGLDTSPGKS
ncbi:hypothetical protein KOR42_36400 [Thalassoglobus neptunius]|uniref:Uncharacterized protein n=1 Tax=Thalassoglobus neptunius TaxID=1938619 RepID=A0A5C5WH19_9PLAN|nr:hypothetical protein [Thalassoglobus neptunius]TWT50094.1 hypothetical protein KOR42_36400 [Thalassoglobus neptunius]